MSDDAKALSEEEAGILIPRLLATIRQKDAEIASLRSRLALCERVVEAARVFVKSEVEMDLADLEDALAALDGKPPLDDGEKGGA